MPGRTLPMPDDTTDADRIHERLRAVERALTGDDRSVAELHDDAAAATKRETLDDRLSDLETRIEELEAATQAVRGYVGSIRAVNREVERRADLALARATDEHDEGDRSEPRGRAPAENVPTETTPAETTPAETTPTETDPAVTAAIPDGTTSTASVENGDLCTDGRGDDDEPSVSADDGPSVSADDGPFAFARDERHTDLGGDSRSSDTDLGRDVISRLREVL